MPGTTNMMIRNAAVGRNRKGPKGPKGRKGEIRAGRLGAGFRAAAAASIGRAALGSLQSVLETLYWVPMNAPRDCPQRIRRMLVQELESLIRAGVAQIALRPSMPPAQPLVRPSEPTSTPVKEEPIVPRASTANRPLDRSSQLAAIQSEVAACRRCRELAATRTQTVFGVGNTRPRLCFMGEAPGADEDRQGLPFVGRAGKLLTDMIEKGMGLARDEVYILNAIKCRPPENRTPTPQEVTNCREYFERQLEVLKPEFICCLGAVAAQALLKTTTPVGKLRGRFHQYQDMRVIVTYHPSYLLRVQEMKKEAWKDLQMLMAEMGLPVPKKS